MYYIENCNVICKPFFRFKIYLLNNQLPDNNSKHFKIRLRYSYESYQSLLDYSIILLIIEITRL